MVFVTMIVRLKAGADPGLMDETGAKPGDVFHDGVGMSQRFEIKKLIRQRYNLMGELLLLYCTFLSWPLKQGCKQCVGSHDL